MSVPLRGNVPTRLRKLAEGQSVDAIVLAAAGLTRLQLDLSAVRGDRTAARMVGAGAGAGRAGGAVPRRRSATSKRRSRCSPTAACVDATRWEREFLRVIEGGCSTPFGCYVVGNRAHLGIATERGWAAHSIELPPDLSEGSQRDSFIRGAVAGCKPVELSETAARALGRALRAR